MSKTLIGTLVGGFILFIWQFLSWTMLNIHGAENTYTPQQDQILTALADIGLEEGTYFLPTAAPGATAEQQEQVMTSALGKPWAKLHYRKVFSMNMGMNMFRGLVVNLLSVFFLCWLLMKFTDQRFSTILLASLAVGAIGYMNIPYIESIWFETNSMGYLVDTVAQWGLVGAWLGWWLPR